MALTRPILYSQVAFDATQEHIFTFNVIGGDQVVANTLTIINNTTSEQVYSEREETFTLTHTLPADSLQNGVYYAATLTTENASGEISVASNTIQFYCYTTPIFNFTNLTTGANLTTSSYNFEVSYNQIESEALEQYSFNLYDYSSNLIATSGILYTNSTTVPFLTQYTFMGFSNNTSYYIECTGITVGGTQITTGLISFGVNYNASSTKLNLINNCIGGYVYVASAPIAIFGTSNPDPPTYIIDGENSYVSLENNGEYVEWDNGFTTSTTDWTLSIWGKNFVEGENIAILSNTSGGNINIEYIINNNEAYYSLTATNNSSNNYYYKIYSNKIIPPNENDEIMIWIRRVNNIYDLFVFNNTSKYITKEGEIVTFYDAFGDREIYDLSVTIDPVQAGSGDPSPDNVRPISGWSETKVWVKPVYDPTANPTITIQLGDTVYGGTLDVTTGMLTVTRFLKTFTGDEPFILATNSRRFTITYINLGIPVPKFTTAAENASQSIFSHGVYRFDSTTTSPFGGYRLLGTSVNFYDVNSVFATADEFKSYLSANYEAGTPWQLCYELATPIEIQLDPVAIETLKGINNVWANTGKVTITYLQ